MDDIRSFEEKYKGSGEEREDLKKAYLRHEGDMDRIMEEVMVCSVRACALHVCVRARVRACVRGDGVMKVYSSSYRVNLRVVSSFQALHNACKSVIYFGCFCCGGIQKCPYNTEGLHYSVHVKSMFLF